MNLKLYNDLRKANIFNLSICFCLTSFGLSISPSSEAGVQLRQWFKSPGYGVSARALKPDPGDLKHGHYNIKKSKKYWAPLKVI
jgi:hypothetical protein